MLTRLRERIRHYLDRGAMFCHSLGLTPTALSLIGFCFSIVTGYLYASSLFYPAAFFLALAGISDALDGSVARLYHQASALGGFLDSVLDRAGEFIIYAGIIVEGRTALEWGLLAAGSSLMVSYIRARAETEGVSMEKIGIAERPERILILFVSTVFGFVIYGVMLVAILSILTIFQRVFFVWKRLSR